MINPDKLSEKTDGTAFMLSLIGLLPGVGDIIKDQIQARISAIEKERMLECVNRVREQVAELKVGPLTEDREKQIENLCITTLQRVRAEGMAEKRAIFADILSRTIQVNLEPTRMDWMQRSVDRLSMMSIDVLRAIAEQSPTTLSPLHSKTGVMAALEHRYTYGVLIPLLRELEAIGIIELNIEQSSKQSGDSRFIVFWKSIGNDFLTFIKRK